MSPGELANRGLSDVSARELAELVQAVKEGWLTAPVTEIGLSKAGLASRHCAAVASLLGDLDNAGVEAVLRVAHAERVHRPPPYLDLVWTGPEVHGTTARDTSILVRQLFERAKRRAIVAGFRFDDCAVLFAPLHQSMARGLRVSLFVDIDGDAQEPIAAKALAEGYIKRLLRQNWPFGPPYPDVYYDPETAMTGPPWVSLHAKCIVIDDASSFISSANFTARGQVRNIEVGVCIEDRDFAERLSGHFGALISRNKVERFDCDLMSPAPGGRGQTGGRHEDDG